MLKLIKYHLKRKLSPKYTYLEKFSIRSGNTVIDLGANIGEVTEYFARRKATVYAYEPNPYAFKVLLKNWGASPHVKLYNSAVSNYTGHSNLWLHVDHSKSEVEFSQASSLQAEKSNVSKDAVQVDVIDIADVLAQHKHIRLLKVDIEGGEYDIIDEIIKNIAKIDFVLLETHAHKHKAFEQKEHELQEKIQDSGSKQKFFTDWF